ncbi:MAG TPA: hypothetical protein DCG22_04220 [Bacteroidetes bacterium]|nr:hypothetical protein [Bacteroidota bacterium]
MRLIRILTFSNFWIAVGAAAFCQAGYLFLGDQPHWDLLNLFCFLSCWSVYLLIRVAAVKRITHYERTHRWQFFLDHIRFFRLLTFSGLLAVAVIYFFLPFRVRMVLLLPGFISLSYGLPVTARRRKLRDIGIIKVFLIGFVWAFVGSILPAAAGEGAFSPDTIALFFAQFLFIFANALPFDISDMKSDAMHAVRTIPYYLGAELTYTLSFVCLVASGAIHGYFLPDTAVPAGVTIMLSGLLIYMSGQIKHEQVLFFGIDSLMLLQFLLVWSYLFVH